MCEEGFFAIKQSKNNTGMAGITFLKTNAPVHAFMI